MLGTQHGHNATVNHILFRMFLYEYAFWKQTNYFILHVVLHGVIVDLFDFLSCFHI